MASQTEMTRLEKLVEELGSHGGYAAGTKAFPTPISDDDAVAIAEVLADEFDKGVQTRNQLAEKAGMKIYCHAGCKNCCEIMVMVYPPEAEAIARYLRRDENAHLRTHFTEAYPAWREAVGDIPERLSTLFRKSTRDSAKAYDDLHMEQWRKRVLCAFNKDGACSIYPVRPLACRNAHALDTDQNCLADSKEPASAVNFPPLKEFHLQSSHLLRALGNARAGKHPKNHQQAVCAAVHDLLDR